MKIGDKVHIYKNGNKISGKVTFIEEMKGYRGYPYNMVHVIVDGEEHKFREWDLTDG